MPKLVVESLAIPLPPLPEQRAIAHVLRTVQRAKEGTEAVITATRELKKSLMRHLFTYGPVPVEEADKVPLKETEIGVVPEQWALVRLGDACEFLQYGTSERCHERASGYPVLRIPNVLSGKIEVTDLKFLEASDEAAARLRLAIGDLLFVRTNGRREYTGRSAVYEGEPRDALFASYLIRARMNRDVLIPHFLHFYTTTDQGKGYLSGRASSASDGKYNINTQTIRAVPVPAPPINDQSECARVLATVESKIAAEEKRSGALDSLSNSLLQHLMTGKVRVKDLVDTGYAAG